MFCQPNTAPVAGKAGFGVLHATQLIGHAARLYFIRTVGEGRAIIGLTYLEYLRIVAILSYHIPE